MRRIHFQLSILASCVGFGLTLWRSLDGEHVDLLTVSLRAIGAGVAVMVFSLLIVGLVEKLGGPAR